MDFVTLSHSERRIEFCCGAIVLLALTLPFSRILGSDQVGAGDLLYQQAQQALARADYDRAISLYQDLIRSHKDSAHLFFMLGVAEYQKGDCTRAGPTLRRALDLQPGLTVADAFWGLCEARLGRPENSIPLLKKSFESRDPDIDPELRKLVGTRLGELYLETDRTTEAEPIYLSLIRQFPGDSEILYDSFWLYLRRADQTMERLVGTDPDSYLTHQLLGRLFAGRHDYRTAADHFRLALKRNPAAPGLHYELGNALLALSPDDPSAAKEYEEELRLHPDHAESYYQLGTLALSHRDLDRAWDFYNTTLKFAPRHANAMIGLATICMSKGHPDEALSYLEKAVRLDPSNPKGHYLLSRVFRALGRTDEAASELALYEKVQTQATKSAEELLDLPGSP